MEVELAILMAFLYATICMIVSSCNYRPLGVVPFCLENVSQLIFVAILCLIAYTEGSPCTTTGWVVFAVYCAIILLLYLSQLMRTVNYIIDKDKVYDFQPKGVTRDEYGRKVHVGYINNGISKTAVVVENCEEISPDNPIKVKYSGNEYKEPLKVKFYEEERHEYVLYRFNIYVVKVDV